MGFSPIQILREAQQSVPAVKYAAGIAGVAAVVAIVAGFQIDLRIAVFGTITVLGLMFVLLIFSSLAAHSGPSLAITALFAAWSFMLLTVVASGLLVTSYFFAWPRSIDSYLPLSNMAEAGNGTIGIKSKISVMRSNYENREWDSAIRVADEILEIDPNNVPALNKKGSVAFHRQDFLTAIKFFEKVVELRPGHPTFMSNLADSYVEVGRIDDAIKVYRSIEPWGPDNYYELGRAYVYNGEYEKAIKLLESLPSTDNEGRARIAEAAAYAGLSTNKDSNQAKKALELLRAGVAQNREKWYSILVGQIHDVHEGHSEIIKLLSNQIDIVLKGGAQ